MPANDKRSLFAFFSLALALTVPFWILGATGWQLLPGLPASALAAFCPALAALILRYRQSGRTGALDLLARSFDARRISAKIWYVPILLIAPAEHVLSWFLLRGAGVPVPIPQFFPITAAAMFAAFFVGALGEELGWSGYAIDPMQERWGALRAAALLGAIWAAWHIVALLQAHRSVAWITWWTIGTVSARIIMVCLYNNAGRSVFAVTLFHAISNLSWQISPNLVAYYDPRISAVILAAVALLIAMTVPANTFTLPTRRR
jgi:membrane protease YdiL (CAAX protease family)